MWQVATESLQKGEVLKYHLSKEGQLLTWAQVIKLWQEDKVFSKFFTSVLSYAPFSAFFWECQPVTQTTIHLPFEFVIVNSPQLSNIKADLQAFSQYFIHKTAYTSSFTNLGGDAYLLVPVPHGVEQNYAHLAAFVRYASKLQQYVFWQSLGKLVEGKMSQQPMWISTSGLGVYWLHVRLDFRPKYYQFAPYRQFTV